MLYGKISYTVEMKLACLKTETAAESCRAHPHNYWHPYSEILPRGNPEQSCYVCAVIGMKDV